MKRITKCLLLVLLIVSISSTVQAFTLNTTDFITSPTNFNGFENIGSSYFAQGTVYSEGGINVKYVGSASIWTTYTPYVGGQGAYGWYESGGGYGYTQINMANGSDFQNIQFLAGNGWGVNTPIEYQLLENGIVVSSGTTMSTTPMSYVGFSGSGFDQINIQSTYGLSSFSPSNYDALAIDSIAVFQENAPVPEPGTMMLLGLGMFGFAIYGKRRNNSKV